MLYRILLCVVLALILTLAAGTAYGLIHNALRGRNTELPPEEVSVPGEESIFSGIGTIRASTKGEEPETVIITIAFPYDSKDGPFSEELASRIPDFKAQALEYLGSFTAEELHQKDPAQINSELLGRYNGLLRLGQIRELFFIDYTWL